MDEIMVVEATEDHKTVTAKARVKTKQCEDSGFAEQRQHIGLLYSEVARSLLAGAGCFLGMLHASKSVRRSWGEGIGVERLGNF
jgi:hypothetical protein